MPNEKMSRLLTTKDVRYCFKISDSTMRRILKENLLPIIRIGTAIRFDPDDVAKFLVEQKRPWTRGKNYNR